MAAPPTPVDVIMEDYPKPLQADGDLPDFMLSDDPQFDRLKEYARNLPYRIESNAHMQRLLDFIIKRYLLDCSLRFTPFTFARQNGTMSQSSLV
jgi:hypothetical protein